MENKPAGNKNRFDIWIKTMDEHLLIQ